MPGIVVDFSGGSCRVGLYKARTGKVEIIKNGYGNVDTPSYVAYTDHEELPIVGEAARDQAASNSKNTVYDLYLLVGLDFSKAKELREKLGWPFEVCDDGGGKAAVQVEIQGVRKVYSAVEIASHLFAKMRRTAEAHINGEVRDAVVVVPWIMFPKQEARTAVKEAANMAGLTGTVVTNSVAFFVESAVRKQPPLAPNGVHILHWDQFGINMAMWNSSNTKRWQWTRFSISENKQWIGGMTNIGFPPIQQQFSQLKPTIKKVLHLGRETMLHEKLEPGMDDMIMVVWNLEKKVLHEAVLYGAKKWGEMGQGDGNDGEVAPWWFDRKFVFFDTGPGNVVIEGRKQIVQLACVSGDGRTFNVYTNPTNEEGEFEYEMKEGRFFEYHGKDVEHTSREDALDKFCKFLQGLEAKVILVAHNAGVDMSPLIDHLVEFNKWERFSSLVEGVTDTLCLFNGKNPLRHLKKNLIPIYQAPKDAHNALRDSWVLRELCFELGADTLEKNHKSLKNYVILYNLENINKGLNLNFVWN